MRNAREADAVLLEVGLGYWRAGRHRYAARPHAGNLQRLAGILYLHLGPQYEAAQAIRGRGEQVARQYPEHAARVGQEHHDGDDAALGARVGGKNRGVLGQPARIVGYLPLQEGQCVRAAEAQDP